MKNTLISFTIFIFMLLCTAFSINYLNNICKNLTTLNNEIKYHINNNNWGNAYISSNNFNNKWNIYSSKISIFVNHEEIDNINGDLIELNYYIKSKEKDECIPRLNKINFLIKHILNMEKINLKNIF